MTEEPVWLLVGDDGYELLAVVPGRLVKVPEPDVDFAAWARDSRRRSFRSSSAYTVDLAAGHPIPHKDAGGRAYSGEPIDADEELLAFLGGTLSAAAFRKHCGI